jgi:hypothetical protein
LSFLDQPLDFFLSFLKISYLMVMSAFLSVLPDNVVKHWLYNWVALTCFRILSRSFSGVIKFHNKHLRPKSDGICVANHTTPIDVVVLSYDRSYALVRPFNFWSNFAREKINLFGINLCCMIILTNTNDLGILIYRLGSNIKMPIWGKI